MEISFIICCYNSADRISKTLNAILKAASQGGVDSELIVVNNCSSDNTLEVVKKTVNKATGISVTILDETIPGLMSARLKGASVAKGEYLSFIDDDNEIALNWVCEVKKVITKYPTVGIIGALATCNYSNLPSWFNAYQASFACGSSGRKEGVINRLVNYGAGMTVKAEAWDKVSSKLEKARNFGRRSGDFGSNDDELIHILIRNMNYDIVYEPNLKLIHNLDESRLNWDHLSKMKLGFGSGVVRMNKFLLFNSGFRFWIYLFKLVKSIFMSILYIFFFSLKYSFNKKTKVEGSASYLEFMKSIGRLKGLIV